MTPDSFLAKVRKKMIPAPEAELLEFEASIGSQLPEDYRTFLVSCNGGVVGGLLWFKGPTPSGEKADAGVHQIGAFRTESHFSLEWHRDCYEGRIPDDLLWIMDDPFGNAVCIAVRGEHRGRIFFWDHENEPDEDWDGTLEGAENLQLLASTFSDFIAGLVPNDDA